MDIIKTGMLSMIVFTIIPVELASVEIQPVQAELTVQEKIKLQAEEYGVDAVKMHSIADAESTFRNVCNWKYTDESGKYTACGIFQITKTTWKSYCDENNQYENRIDEDKNIECAMKIASKSGYHHWDESKSSWSSNPD